jgi:hypothetical protein
MQQYIQAPEHRAYSSRCPALPNLVTGTVAFINGLNNGCGSAGAGNIAYTGSTCTQTCSGGQVRVGGAANGAQQTCANGEWVSLGSAAGTNGGPVLCANACPALPLPTFLANAAACSHTLLTEDFSGTAATLSTWYPRWKMYRTSGDAVMTYGEQETGMLFTNGLGLLYPGEATGRRGLWAVNEPLWGPSTPTSTTPLSITADVGLLRGTSVAGLALRVAGDPASFYLLKINAGAGNVHRFVRYDPAAGGETDIGSAGAATGCTMAGLNAGGVSRRFKFTVAGNTLSATCDGVSMGSLADNSVSGRLYQGSAGIYAQASRVVVDNVLIERGCDGAGGGCIASAPGASCTMACVTGASTIGSTSRTCQTSGAWSGSTLTCMPVLTAASPLSIAETAAAGAPIGSAMTLAPLTGGYTAQFAISASVPSSPPLTVGVCDGQLRVAPGGALDYETVSSYSLTITAQLAEVGAASLLTSTVVVNVVDVNEPPAAADASFTTPDNIAINTFIGNVTCVDVDALPLTLSFVSDPTGGLFRITSVAAPGGARGMVFLNRAGALDYSVQASYVLSVKCADTGTPSLSSTARLTINLQATKPVFVASSLALSIMENAASGAAAQPSLQALDPLGRTITYSLGAPSTMWVVTAAGSVQVASSAASALLDYETRPTWTLAVRATSTAGDVTNGTAVVSLVNVNEAPVLTAGMSRAVPERSVAGTAVGVPLTGWDAEDGTGQLVWWCTAPCGGGAFTVDSSGQIRVAAGAPLDYFGTRSYSLAVAANDTGAPDSVVLKATTTVTVNIAWVNVAPVFTGAPGAGAGGQPVYNFTIAENSALGAALGATLHRRSWTCLPLRSPFRRQLRQATHRLLCWVPRPAR